MGTHKNDAKGEAEAQKGTLPTPLSDGGEAGDTGDAVHVLRDDVASLEEGLSQMDAPSNSHKPANYHQNDLYHLIIDKIIPHTKIGHAFASTSEWL